MSHEPGPPPSGDSPGLGDRLNRLFDVTGPATVPERAWRNSEVAAVCRAHGRELSESHLSELRRGVKRNPTLRTLETLAWFFGVPVSFFTDAGEHDVEQELRARREKRDAEKLAREEARAAALELQEALRRSGVTRTASRGLQASTDWQERAEAMRALTRLLAEDDVDRAGDA